MKKFTLAALSAIVMLSTAGCSSSTVSVPKNGARPGNVRVLSETNVQGVYITEFEYTLTDGRKMICLAKDGGSDGGMSCIPAKEK